MFQPSSMLEHAFLQRTRRCSSLPLGWSMHFYSQLGDAPAFFRAGACIFTANSAMLQPSSRLEHTFLQPARQCSSIPPSWILHFFSQLGMFQHYSILGWSIHFYSELGDAPAFFWTGACIFTLEHTLLQLNRQCSSLLVGWSIHFDSQLGDAPACF